MEVVSVPASGSVTGITTVKGLPDGLTEKAVEAARRIATAGYASLFGGYPDAVVVDLCCGSGAVGAAVAAAVIFQNWADSSPVAWLCGRL